MSKYSMQLRNFFEPLYYDTSIMTREETEEIFKSYNLEDYLTQEQINVINEAGTWSKDKLAKKIVDHYYMSEIGFETIGLFIHYAKVTMEEIMEEYLPLIYSRSIEYNPLVNVDYTETFSRKIENGNTGSSTSNTNSSGLAVSSDTPQGQISKESILEGNYATSTSANESDSTNNIASQSNSNTDETYSKNVKGNSGVSATAQKMIEQYRNNIRAIDKEIIEKLNILFMGLF